VIVSEMRAGVAFNPAFGCIGAVGAGHLPANGCPRRSRELLAACTSLRHSSRSISLLSPEALLYGGPDYGFEERLIVGYLLKEIRFRQFRLLMFFERFIDSVAKYFIANAQPNCILE
jgi:hypothetical protein